MNYDDEVLAIEPQPFIGMDGKPVLGVEQVCGTCRFRGEEIVKEGWKEDDWKDKPTGYFLCTRIKHDRAWAYPKGSGATVEDGSGYHAALCVESDFGCNRWEAKG